MSIKALVVHGYGYNKDGWLGLNELVCQKAAELWKTGEYDYLLLPAGVNEDTGDGERLIGDDHIDYLICNFWHSIPPDELEETILWSPRCAGPLASDTMTECGVVYSMLSRLCVSFSFNNRFEIHVVGVFPHSLKIQRCWNLFLQKGIARLYPHDDRMKIRLGAVHHLSPRLDSWSETVRQLLMNIVSTAVGLYDPFGKHWPATVIKRRRRDLYTPKHLRDRVIF